MTLEELIFSRMVGNAEIQRQLTQYESRPAVFLQKCPDDTADEWNGIQYPRADYVVDMRADPERHSSGVVTVNIYSNDAGTAPEDIAPHVRTALCDIIMQADDGAYCIAWDHTELFEMTTVQSPNTQVNGCMLTFLVIAFPEQLAKDPDPAFAINEFLKTWEPDSLVIGKDHIDTIYEPSDKHPAFYVRIAGYRKNRATYALTWVDCTIAVHVIAPTPEGRSRWSRYLADTLLVRGDVDMMDGAPLLVKDLAVDSGAEYLTQGQITIKAQYAITNFNGYAHPLKEAYFNQ